MCITVVELIFFAQLWVEASIIKTREREGVFQLFIGLLKKT